jgi:hypothetical protein
MQTPRCPECGRKIKQPVGAEPFGTGDTTIDELAQAIYREFHRGGPFECLTAGPWTLYKSYGPEACYDHVVEKFRDAARSAAKTIAEGGIGGDPWAC